MIIHKNGFIPLLFAALIVATPPSFAQESIEHNELATILRQLEWIQNIATNKANTPVAQPSRYTFDYQRFSNDIAHIQTGIRDYLSPKRAQPRDPIDISGNYQVETMGIGSTKP